MNLENFQSFHNKNTKSCISKTDVRKSTYAFTENVKKHDKFRYKNRNLRESHNKSEQTSPPRKNRNPSKKPKDS